MPLQSEGALHTYTIEDRYTRIIRANRGVNRLTLNTDTARDMYIFKI